MRVPATLLPLLSLSLIVCVSLLSSLGHVEHKPLQRGISHPPRAVLQRNVFFDLGANNGDSLGAFVGIYSHGGGGDSLNGRGATGEWDLWVFEANPIHTAPLSALIGQIQNAFPQHRVFSKVETAIGIQVS